MKRFGDEMCHVGVNGELGVKLVCSIFYRLLTLYALAIDYAKKRSASFTAFGKSWMICTVFPITELTAM